MREKAPCRFPDTFRQTLRQRFHYLSDLGDFADKTFRFCHRLILTIICRLEVPQKRYVTNLIATISVGRVLIGAKLT